MSASPIPLPAPVLIETMRVVGGKVPLWAYHRARIETSCKALGLPLPGRMQIPGSGADVACRFEIGSGGVRAMSRAPGSTAPLEVITARTPHRPYPHKTTDRTCFDLAAAEAKAAGAEDAILLTPEGFVAEGTVWTVCWWEMNLLCAPPLGLGVLPGVGRARIQELRLHIVEKRVQRRALAGVPVFLVNAVRGVVEVSRWDGHQVPRHPETARLAQLFWP